jgi:hypothetical protein
MTQDLVSSVPGVYTALLGLIQSAAAATVPPTLVFPFELGQYEPGSYVTVHEIAGPEYVWESIGFFTQRETFEIRGCVTVFSGSSVTDGSTVVTDVLAQTMSLFQTCVMTPVMSNRDMPILGTTGPSPFLMLPGPRMQYHGEVGLIGGNPGGWVGVYDWSFQFEALITPE